MRKRLLSALLALCMVLTLLPTQVLAVEESPESDIWDGTVAAGFESGSGTAADPYQISTGAQLAYLASSVTSTNDYNGRYFLQTSDLVLAGHEWSPIGSDSAPFSGNYDGGGHTITGLTLTEESYDRRGLFGNIYHNGSVKNLTLVNANVCGNNRVGGIIGQIIGDSSGKNIIVSNCHIQGSTITGTENVGGIVGYLWWANVENSTADRDTTVIGTTSIGGIVGYALGTSSVSLCGNSAPVTGTDNVGGVVGYAHQSPAISQCYNKGAVTGSNQVGGVCGYGYQSIKISNCYNVGEIRATSSSYYTYVGGIAAQNYSNGGSTSYCYNYGNVYKAGSLRNDLIVGYSLGSSMSNCYYLSQEATSDGKGLTEAQMANQDSFVGFDFQSIWVMNTLVGRPVLRSLLEVPTTLYCDLVVLDATTYLPIEGVLVTEDGSWDTYLGWTYEDGTISLSDSAEKFASETTLFFTKEGYQTFVCFYKDLDADSYQARPQNSIYMVPDNQDPGEDSNEQAFINEHISFIKNRYNDIIRKNDFYDIVWQYDEGKRLWAVYLWEVVGDIGEVATLKFDDLVIQADYYDLFISDLILELTENEYDDRFETKIIDTFQKIYNNVTNNIVAKIDNIIGADETIDKAYKDILNDTKLLHEELDKFLNGNYDGMKPYAKDLYEIFFEKILDDEVLYYSIFEGAHEVSNIASLYTDTKEFAANVVDAFILAKSCCEVNEEIFQVLYDAVEKMRAEKPKYASWMKDNIDKYYKIATNEEEMMDYLIKEAKLNLLDLVYNHAIKDAVKKCAYKFITENMGCTIPQLELLTLAYNGTYKFFNQVTKNHEKGEQYCIMNYIAPFEKSLEAIVRAKGGVTVSEQTYERAKEYDLAYSLLRYTNKYLYESAYNFATLTNNPNDMYYATAYKNAWNSAKCHNTVIADRSKYINVQCPVDVYLYGPGDTLVLSIVNEEVVICNDESITVMVCNGEKAIMYPADTDYTITIVARTEGTMDYSVVEVEGIEPVRYVDFYDLSLRENQTYTGSIPADFRIDNVVYTLETDLTELSCDYDSDATPECDLNGHSYGEWVTETEPTTEDFGLKKRTCSTCGKVESSSIQPIKAIAYTVNVNASPTVGGSVSGGGTYDEGESVTVKATPANGYHFARWTENGTTVSNDASYTFTVEADRMLTAVFEAEPGPPAPNTYTVTVTASPTEGGTVIGGGTYGEGESVTVTATANSGYRFVSWTENGTTVSTSATYTFKAEANRTLTAIFEWVGNGGYVPTPGYPSYQITVPTTSNGTVTVTPTSAKSGTKVTITATPNSGHKVDSLTVTNSSGKSISVTDNGDGTYTFTMPASQVTVSVTFVAIKTPWANPFTDVSKSDWFYDGVAYVAQNGLMQGVGGGRFNPSGTTSRGMIATILYRLENEPTVSQPTFTDVAAGQYYTEAVAWAAANKIVEGYGNNAFGPNDNITREQMATILYRYAVYKGYDVSGLADLSGYTDAGSISSWALTAMRWANSESLIGGRTTTTLAPDGTTTRAEAATILMRFCQNVAGLE